MNFFFEFFVLILRKNTNVEENVQNETTDKQEPNTNPNLNTDTNPNMEGEQDRN